MNTTPSDAIPAQDKPAYFRPVIPLLFALMAGILGARYGPAWTAWMIGPAGITSLCATAYGLIRNRTAKTAPLLLYACLGYFLLFTWTAERRFSDHVSRFIDDGQYHISGAIVETSIPSRFRQTCVLDEIEITKARRDPFTPLHGKIRVSIYGADPVVRIGDRIGFFSKIRPLTNFKNPGAFNYRQYMADRHIWGTAYTDTLKITVTTAPGTAGPALRIQGVRASLSGLIHRATDTNARPVLMALLLGERRQIAEELRDAFNRAGVSHILAISGLHVGIVATAAFFSFKWLLSFWSFLLWRGWVSKTAAILAIMPVVFYGLLAGMSPSTQRAVIMISVFLMTFLLEKEHDIFNTLAIAGLIILIIDPPALFSVSFQLSFSAVAAILYGLEKSQKGLHHFTRPLPKTAKPVIGFMWVTCLAILGTAPVVMYYFNQLPVFGVLANLAIVPLIGFISVPVGLFSILVLNLFSVEAAVLGLRLSAWVLDGSIWVVDLIARCPYSAVKTVTPSLPEILCYYLFLWCLFNIRRPGGASCGSMPAATDTPAPLSKASRHQRWHNLLIRRGNPVLPVLLITVIIAAADTAYWVHKRFFDDSLRVTILDVGQGSAALLELPRGPCVLIDGGGFSDNTIFDMGRWVLAPYLWRNKIRTVDTVILSHPDADHVNGLVYILKHFRVGRVISTHEPADHKEYMEFIALIRDKNIPHPDFSSLPRSFAVNGVVFDLLYPPDDFMDPDAAQPWRNPNDNSLVVRVTHGPYAVMFPGDITADAEKELMAMHPAELAAAILIAPHHGSRTSSTPAFLDAVNPRAVVVSSGRPATFPAAEVMEQYKNRGIDVFRTDTNGALRLISNGQELSCRPIIGKPLTLQTNPAYMEIDPLR
jgi:competence protein ComEC